LRGGDFIIRGMAWGTGGGDKPLGCIGRIFTFVLVIGGVLFLMFVALPMPETPTCEATAGTHLVSFTQPLELALDQGCWSGPISLPAGAHSVEIEHKEDLEIRFANGERMSFAVPLFRAAKPATWTVAANGSDFQLRPTSRSWRGSPRATVRAKLEPDRVYRFTLEGEDRLTRAVNLKEIAPGAGWTYTLSGPKGAKVHFSDGTVASLDADVGAKGGTIRFSGPAGREVVLTLSPPIPK
jgi:hypothetical protein